MPCAAALRIAACVLLACPVLAVAADAVLQWLVKFGGGERAFPLMDFVTSDVDDIDIMVDSIGAELASPCTSGGERCETFQRISELVQGMLQRALPDEVQEAALCQWLLQLDWLGLVTHREDGLPLLTALKDLSEKRAAQIQQADCDVANSHEDLDYIDSVQRSMDGIESLPLERNEFKWADFFFRTTRNKGLCSLGMVTLFLVAADITAYAAGAVAGEHFMRLRRALRLGQEIARQHVATTPGKEDLSRIDLLRTRWPLWSLLVSIAQDLVAEKDVQDRSSYGVDMHPLSSIYRRRLSQESSTNMYLSIVVQCRNDDYGVGMLTRLNRMLSTTTLMFHTAGLPTEIILVEWNPPFGKEPISEVIERAPGTASTVPIRVIRVMPSVHMRIPHHKAHPIFEHIAENVAFRRARGKFILKTNIDNIFSPDTVMFLKNQELRDDVVYRATYLEHDVTVPETEGLEAAPLLEWLFKRPGILEDANSKLQELSMRYPEDSRICHQGHTAESGDLKLPTARPFYWAGSGDFVLASRALVSHVHGYPQISQNWQTDDLIHCRFRAAGARQVVLQPPCVTVHQNHRRINRIRASTRWIVTDGNFEEICRSPFKPLPTETGLGDNWGFPEENFEEVVL